MSNVVYPIGGNGGLPSDGMTNEVIGDRRFKVDADSSVNSDIYAGSVFTFRKKSSFSSSNPIALNVQLVETIQIMEVKAASSVDVLISVKGEKASGSSGDMITANNMNLCSSNTTQVIAQEYTSAVTNGNVIDVGRNELKDSAVECSNSELSIVFEPLSTTDTTDITYIVKFKEMDARIVGAGEPYIGLLPDTALISTTEMSDFG